MASGTPIPAPGPEHDLLARKVGSWDVDCEYFFAASPEPMRARGVDVVRALGPYWVIAEARIELPGFTIVGQATSGFDPVSRRFRSTWIDSATPYLYTFEGAPPRGRNLLEMEGINRDPQSGREVRYRSREIFGGPDDRIFELIVESSPGLDTPLLRYQYTRRK
jgi:hypothetical protein